MRTTRRRNRLRSAQYATERWKPSALFVVLGAGLLFGLALGLSGRVFGQSADVQQHYMLLVSDLYAQGVPLSNVRDRLVSLGYSNPSVAVLAVADQLAHSQDKVSQQEADQLHQFAEALVAGSDTTTVSQGQALDQSAATPSVVPSPLSSPVPAVAIEPTSTVTAVPTVEPTATVIDEPASNPTAVPEASPTPTKAPPAPPQPTAAKEKAGVIHTPGRQPAILRSGPTTKSTAVAVVPDGAKVAVYGVIRGQALEPPEARWYHIVYNGRQGYLYLKLVQVGG